MEAGALPRVAPPMAPTLTPRLLRLASDSRLVGLVRDGRRGAFEVLYDRHHKGILSFCRHMLSDPDEAEDAVQHTFMAAYSDLMASNKPIQLRAWLFTIARNRCYSILRARREQPSAEIAEIAGEGLASQVQRRQDLRDLVHDMRQLPEEQRAALLLAELDALSHAEIADVLGVPREKVKALVFQARESLLASRTARDTACAEIREQIACGRGASLRRANLRRHLRECDGCREFRAQVERQRRQFALFLPVGPALALKEAVLGATAVTGGTAAAGSAAAVGGGVIASSAIKSGLAKGLIGATLAGVGAAGTLFASGTGLHIRSLVNLVTHTLSGRPARVIATARAPERAAHHHRATYTAAGSRTSSLPATVEVSSSPAAAGSRADRAASRGAHSGTRLGGVTGHRHAGVGHKRTPPAAPAGVTHTATGSPAAPTGSAPSGAPAASTPPAPTTIGSPDGALATSGPATTASMTSASATGRPGTAASIAGGPATAVPTKHGPTLEATVASFSGPGTKAHGRGHNGASHGLALSQGPAASGQSAPSGAATQPGHHGHGHGQGQGQGHGGFSPQAQGGANPGATPGGQVNGPQGHGGHGNGHGHGNSGRP